MGDLWDRFAATGKVEDYLEYRRKGEDKNCGIQYRSDGDGSLSDSYRGVRQADYNSDKGEGENHGLC